MFNSSGGACAAIKHNYNIMRLLFKGRTNEHKDVPRRTQHTEPHLPGGRRRARYPLQPGRLAACLLVQPAALAVASERSRGRRPDCTCRRLRVKRPLKLSPWCRRKKGGRTRRPGRSPGAHLYSLVVTLHPGKAAVLGGLVAVPVLLVP